MHSSRLDFYQVRSSWPCCGAKVFASSCRRDAHNFAKELSGAQGVPLSLRFVSRRQGGSIFKPLVYCRSARGINATRYELGHNEAKKKAGRNSKIYGRGVGELTMYADITRDRGFKSKLICPDTTHLTILHYMHGKHTGMCLDSWKVNHAHHKNL